MKKSHFNTFHFVDWFAANEWLHGRNTLFIPKIDEDEDASHTHLVFPFYAFSFFERKI